MMHWITFLSVNQKHQNLILMGCYDMKLMMGGYHNDCTIRITLLKQCSMIRALQFWYAPHFFCSEGKHPFSCFPWSLHLLYCLSDWYQPAHCLQSTPGTSSQSKTPHFGHPSKLSATATCSILTQIAAGKGANAYQVARHIGTIIPYPVSTQTIRNIVKKHSFNAVTKEKIPLLSTVHRKKQLAFALRHKGWTVEVWKGGWIRWD